MAMRLLRQLQYSFPVRLVLLHFRSHLLLVFLWVFLTMLVSGQAGRMVGMHYLMLTPEYCGNVGFRSFFLTGAAMGAFFMIWNLTTYLLCADRFPFLATLSAPFTKFSLNNSLFPLVFLLVYLVAAVWFQVHDEMTQWWDIVANLGGLLMGATSFIALLAGYLHVTNKDIASFLRPGKFVPNPGGRLLVPGRRIPTLGEIKAGATRWRVDTYLTERLHVRWVRSVAHYDPFLIGRVFRQNHANAVAVQAAAFALLMIQGWWMEVEWLRFPTSVSVFVLVSIAMSLFGAISFWFRQWGTFIFIALVLLVDAFTAKGYFIYRNRAFGLDYAVERRPDYNYALLEKLSSDSTREADKKSALAVLERWKARQNVEKPKMVLVCVSGGGHRAALWTMRVLQTVDSLSKDALSRQCVLMTGASGGMLGAAYYREALLRLKNEQKSGLYRRELLDDLGKDLLNPITSALVSNDLLFPFRQYRYAGQTYRIDRAFYFEKQFNENLRGWMDRNLADYRPFELSAEIPMMVLSPYILNDSRRMLISPLPVSYLTRPPEGVRKPVQAEIDGVEWSRLLAGQQADSLAFRSALRMNCTFPFILPNTWLPTQPALEMMDAGARDNFGITLATRFTQVFRDWIRENTSGVVVVQIRCWEKIEKIEKGHEKGIIGNLLTPAEAVGRLTILQDFEHDSELSLLSELLYPHNLEVVRFTYRPVRRQREASLSFHLSKREQIDIYEAFDLPQNMSSVQQLLRALK